jgi:hypothetical protein
MLSRTAPDRHRWCSNTCSSNLPGVGTWEADDPAYSRPIAAPLERCAELLGVDLATIQRAASDVEPYIRVDGTKVWSLMQLERQLRPEAYGRVRGGYISRQRPPAQRKRSPRVGGVSSPVDRAGLCWKVQREEVRRSNSRGGDMRPAELCRIPGKEKPSAGPITSIVTEVRPSE